MKNKKAILIFLTVALIICVAITATACNPEEPSPTLYTLTFIADGAPLTAITAEAGKPVVPPNAPSVEGKVLKGWFYNAEGDGNAVALPTFMPAQNLTYYAVYEADRTEPKPVPNDTFTEKGGDKKLYVFGDEAVFEFDGKEIRAELSPDGEFVDFTVKNAGSDTQTAYCVTLDYDEKTYSVYRYGADPNSYVLYFPIDNTFNFERSLYFRTSTEFEVMSPTFGSYTTGTYGPYGTSPNEFTLTIEKNYPYNPFEVERIKTTKVLRADSDNASETLIYNAFLTYEKLIAGEFLIFDTADKKSHLTLDGYGYGTYTDENGKVYDGVVEQTHNEVFVNDVFINFRHEELTEDVLFVLIHGSLNNAFAKIGREIGIYRIWDIAAQTAGSYYLLLDGFGGATIYFGASEEYKPETVAAEGSYALLDSGEVEYTVKTVVDEIVLPEKFRETFKFKFTTYGSGLYETKAFVTFDEDLFKQYVDESGTATLTLDGYGNAVYSGNGVTLNGSMLVSDGLVLVTDKNGAQGLFVVFDGDGTEKGTFKQIGLERGNYLLYSYVNGFDSPRILFLDGEGNAQLFKYDENEIITELAKGTYSFTETEGNYTLTFGDETFIAAFRQINFGSLYYPDWRYVYIMYDENLAGTLVNADRTETLVLDGFGLNAVYTDSTGKVYKGNFAKEWDIITLLSSDKDGNYAIYTFTISGNTFAVAGDNAGVYYEFSLANNLSSTDTKLLLDGSGKARLSVYESETANYVYTDGAYTFDASSNEFTLTLSDSEPFKFKLVKRGNAVCFVRYDENWKGTFSDAKGKTLVLDGYGNAEYDYENVPCLLMGSNLDVVTLTVFKDIYTFVLDRTNMKFSATNSPCGYYYPYSDGVISGYTRLFLGANGTAEISEYDKATNSFLQTAAGEYSQTVNGIYEFVQSGGEQKFSFKLDSINGNSIYSKHIGNEGVYTSKQTVNGIERTFELTLDGYGNAEYFFIDSKYEEEHRYTGYYSVLEDGKIKFGAVNYDYGYEYATLVFELNENEFTIVA